MKGRASGEGMGVRGGGGREWRGTVGVEAEDNRSGGGREDMG